MQQDELDAKVTQLQADLIEGKADAMIILIDYGDAVRSCTRGKRNNLIYLLASAINEDKTGAFGDIIASALKASVLLDVLNAMKE